MNSNFFTLERLLTMLAGAFFGLVFILGAWLAGFETTAGNLLVNLSASAIMIGITIYIADYFSARQQERKLLPAYRLGLLEIEEAVDFLIKRLADSGGMSVKIKNPKVATVDFLIKADWQTIQKEKMSSSDLATLAGGWDFAAKGINEAIQFYGYALKPEVANQLLLLRFELQALSYGLQLSQQNISLLKSTNDYLNLERVTRKLVQLSTLVKSELDDSGLKR